MYDLNNEKKRGYTPLFLRFKIYKKFKLSSLKLQ